MDENVECLIYYKWLSYYSYFDNYLKLMFFNELQEKFSDVMNLGIFTVETNRLFGPYISYSDINNITNALNNNIAITIHADRFMMLLKSSSSFKAYIKKFNTGFSNA